MVSTLKEEFVPMGANFFFCELTDIEMGDKKENGRVASPEGIPIFKCLIYHNEKEGKMKMAVVFSCKF